MMEVLYHFLVQADELRPGDPDITALLRKAMPMFDGGFHFAGITGNGDLIAAKMK